MVDDDPIIISPADPRWAQEFQEMAGLLRKALGNLALRIDHVGSTSVPGLDAKPIIDIQISVERLEPSGIFRIPIEGLGYVHTPDNPDLTKRFFKNRKDGRGTHIHVRVRGSFDEQLNLVFRDYLRTHPDSAKEYAKVKWDLAGRYRNDRDGYTNAKDPTVWTLLRKAHDWAMESGWSPGPSDA